VCISSFFLTLHWAKYHLHVGCNMLAHNVADNVRVYDMLHDRNINISTPGEPALLDLDAFMRNELPRTTRDSLRAAIEQSVGPIEDDLTNQLERIMENAYDKLLTAYRDSKRTSSTSSGTSADSPLSNVLQPVCTPAEIAGSLAQSLRPSEDALPQTATQPGAESDLEPNGALLTGTTSTQQAFRDSAYSSLPDEIPYPSCVSDVLENDWFDYNAFDSFVDESMFDEISDSEEPPLAGKGKEKAVEDDACTHWDTWLPS
jgi:hypothetical protein